jgi:hypothetical protein
MPGELRDKLKLWETLNKILKNNGIVDVAALEGVVNELKTKLNTLINDMFGVEHSIDNIHNYDDTNIKEELKEITETANQTNISDVNGLVFSYTSSGVRISDFTNANHVVISWDS